MWRSSNLSKLSSLYIKGKNKNAEWMICQDRKGDLQKHRVKYFSIIRGQ